MVVVKFTSFPVSCYFVLHDDVNVVEDDRRAVRRVETYKSWVIFTQVTSSSLNGVWTYLTSFLHDILRKTHR